MGFLSFLSPQVSAKIQQLLNTLKRPKRRPLPEFYEDDDIELEIAANPKDPNAPKPEGGTMTPAVGEQLVVPSGLPRILEAALQRYGTASFKANVATVLDPNGKLSNSLTYGKSEACIFMIKVNMGTLFEVLNLACIPICTKRIIVLIKNKLFRVPFI